MKKMKHIMLRIICFIMVFVMAFVAIPVKTQAILIPMYEFDGPASVENSQIIVYKGTKNLYAGDFIYAYRHYYTSESIGYMTFDSNVTYESSKPSVASIDESTGKIKTKKTGTTTITIKVGKSREFTFKLKVLSKKQFFKTMKERCDAYGEESMDYEQLAAETDKKANVFLGKCEKVPAFTSSNRYKILTAYKSYETSSGYESVYLSNSKREYYCYSTTATHAYAVAEEIECYSRKKSPFFVSSAEHFEVKSITGKKSTITVTLTNKVTADMIYGANYEHSWNTKVKKSKTYTFPIVVQNTSNKYKYSAIATLKEGSNKMTIKLRNGKLVKGKTYQLLEKINSSSNRSIGNWLTETDDYKVLNTFKAK